MTAKTSNTATRPTLTPAERAARKVEAQAKKFTRDRSRMLAHVQACIQQAGTALAAGQISTHDQWLDATETAIASYRQFVALSIPQAPAVTVAAPDIAG